MQPVAIGFRAKTAKAIAVALVREGASPRYAGRWEVSLVDVGMPATVQPHHHVMEIPWPEAQSAARPIEACIEKVAIAALSTILDELQSNGACVNAVGVVGSPDRKLESIGNRHMRAHAAEGILFRRVLEIAAAKHRIRCRSLSDRTIKAVAESELKGDLDATLTTIGREAGRPWRSDERTAAIAAWLVL